MSYKTYKINVKLEKRELQLPVPLWVEICPPTVTLLRNVIGASVERDIDIPDISIGGSPLPVDK